MERFESEVFDGRELRHGHRIPGPAVVELPYTSVAVGVGQALECDAFGNFVLGLDRSQGAAGYGSRGANPTATSVSAGSLR